LEYDREVGVLAGNRRAFMEARRSIFFCFKAKIRRFLLFFQISVEYSLAKIKIEELLKNLDKDIIICLQMRGFEIEKNL
jgi:hypothetical protein